MREHDWGEVRDRIVEESFADLTPDQAVALVGLLSEYRIEYTDELRGIVAGTPGWAARSKPPREPLTLLDAVTSVSRIFRMDARQLFDLYDGSWRDFRAGTVVDSLKECLERHRFVGRLVPPSELP